MRSCVRPKAVRLSSAKSSLHQFELVGDPLRKKPGVVSFLFFNKKASCVPAYGG
jgi:hypothetical protein